MLCYISIVEYGSSIHPANEGILQRRQRICKLFDVADVHGRGSSLAIGRVACSLPSNLDKKNRGVEKKLTTKVNEKVTNERSEKLDR